MVVVALAAIASSSVAAQTHPSDYVNTLRGSGSSSGYSHGNTIPAATRPFGFNFWTPMTDGASEQWLYRYDQNTIQGFAVSHIPSPWIGDHAQLQIMPMVDSLRVDPTARAAAFTHDRELARPYLYRVDLGSGIRTEIAPTDHAAILRFTFTASSRAFLLFDTVDSATGAIQVDRAAGIISGYIDQRVPRMYFYASVDRAIRDVIDPAGAGANAAIGLNASAGDAVTLRIATSFISVEQAHRNLANELQAKTFEQVSGEAQADWDRWLGRIELEGATDAQKWTFYSNLYRVGMYPNAMWEDVQGAPQYRSPFSGALRSGTLYVNNGFWDTYRAAWPLYVLLDPSHAGEMLSGFVDVFDDVGWVPHWSGPDAIDIMVGSHSDAIFGDAYLKGVQGFDAKRAYASMLKNALVVSDDGRFGRKGNRRSIFRGFIPLEDVAESAAWHLEDTINDAVIARMADALGDRVDARYFRARALTYANLFSPSVGFFRGRHADGSFRTSDADFEPNQWGYEFTEGCAWHYVAAASHDPRGMANLYGGRDALEAKLDDVFGASPDYRVGSYGGVIHEMLEAVDTGMGQYAHANEPVHSMIYLYDYAGAPAKAQQHVREVLDRLYGPGLNDGGGYLGDEDNGQMSAWYVFGALGFYPAVAGQTQYAIGSPLFAKATLHLEGGADFVVVAYDNSAQNRFIQRAWLNGVALARPYLEHAEIRAGGRLELEMGPEPSSWGRDPSVAPRSATTTERLPTPAIDRAVRGVASASDDNAGAGEGVAQAFDDDSSTKWLVFDDHGYVQYRFAHGQSHAISLYTVTSANDEPARDPMDWTLAGSDDGSDWTVLDQRRAQSFEWRQQTRVFDAVNHTPYAFYRLTVTRNHGAPITQLAELELLDDGQMEAGDSEGRYAAALESGETLLAGRCSGCIEALPRGDGGCEIAGTALGPWDVLLTLAFVGLLRARSWKRRAE